MAWRQYYRSVGYSDKRRVSRLRNTWLNLRRVLGLKIKAKRIEQ